MEQQKQWVGIDVSKVRLDVYLRPSGKQFQFNNQANDISELIKQLQTFTIEQVILKANRGLELEVAQALQQQGYAYLYYQSPARTRLCQSQWKVGKDRPN
jgi:transposase